MVGPINVENIYPYTLAGYVNGMIVWFEFAEEDIGDAYIPGGVIYNGERA